MGNEKLDIFTERKKTIVVTLLLFVFITGFYLGWTNADKEVSDLELRLDTLNLDIQSMEQRKQFSELFEDECDTANIDFIANKIRETAIELNRLENEGLEDTNEYDLLKRRHNLNQVNYYIDLKQFKERCNYDKDVILFFFNSSEPQKADRQGRVLDELRREEDLVILPMDYGYTSLLDFFYRYHSVSDLPALVINFDTTLEGFSNEEEIKEAIENEQS